MFDMERDFLIFLDWDGTLCWDKFWSGLLGTQEMKIIQDKLFGADHNLVNDWMRGKFSSEEINYMVAKWTNLPYEKLWSDFILSCQNMSLDNSLREKILSLRSTVRVVLTTSNMDCFKRFVVPSLRLENFFDKIIISSEIGFLKKENHGEFFNAALQTFKLPIKRAFLVDDSQTTCDFFTELGGRAVCVKNKKETFFVLKNFDRFFKFNK